MKVVGEQQISDLHHYLGRPPGTRGKVRRYAGDCHLHALTQEILARWPRSVGRDLRVLTTGDEVLLVGDEDANLAQYDAVVCAHDPDAPGLYQAAQPAQAASASWLRAWRKDPRGRLTRDVLIHLLRVLGI